LYPTIKNGERLVGHTNLLVIIMIGWLMVKNWVVVFRKG
jgi:hypothetical protein